MLFVFPSTFAGKSYFLNFSEEPIQAATLAAGDRVSFELNGGIHHIIVDEIGTRKGVRIGFVPAGQNMVNLAPINTDFSAYIDDPASKRTNAGVLIRRNEFPRHHSRKNMP